ncbi:MAG: cell envelope integrity protein TolA [Alphaproteobacteria bacterium]|nr:cell envelope integrity protein TolA [Alphaproteobacteria bacterium]
MPTLKTLQIPHNPSFFLGVSFGIHIILFLLISFWAYPQLIITPDDVVPIEIISEPLALAEVKTEDLAPPDATPQVQAAAQEVAPPPPIAEAIPLPDTPIKTAPPEPQDSLFKVASPKIAPRPEIKTRPRHQLDIGAVRALLNKTPDIATAPTPPQNNETANNGTQGADIVNARLTDNELNVFRAQMQKCWSPPAGARDANSLVVVVRLSLDQQGRLLRKPRVINRERLQDPYFVAAAESVLRAIGRCQPFTMPPDKYAAWRDLELTFDPSKMLGI